MNTFLKKYLLLLLLAFVPQWALAQMDSDYFVADKLLRQQKFEQAYQKFKQLHKENPNVYLFIEKATECLVNLKRYEEAASLLKEAIQDGNFQVQATIRLGEIYHISGDKDHALSVWNELLQNHQADQQIALRVARVMKSRGIFDHSIQIYKKARKALPPSSTITSELAETYLEAGIYSKAIREFLQLVKENPEQVNFVQNRLIRLQNDELYETAVKEISDFLKDLPPRHPGYQSLQKLEIWLLMEQKSFEPALATAKEFEGRTSNVTYTLYGLGAKLLAERQFKLAEEAYSFYIENNISGVKNRSLEELAKVYIEWARYQQNFSLGLTSAPNKLYRKAFSALEALRETAPNYRRMDKVLLMLSELSLDVLHQPQKAKTYLKELQKLNDRSKAAQVHFIEGRIYLYDENYNRARIAFTQSSKQKGAENLAAKSRYYLALTDFYAGDYEFAKIQLKALERQNHSYFANNALQLRLWIQNGLQADSTGSELELFARAVEYFSQNDNQHGIDQLKNFLESHKFHPLFDDALQELTSHKNEQNVIFVYEALNKYLSAYGPSSPLYEQLLWEKARIADQLVTNPKVSVDVISANDSPDSTVLLPANIDQLVPLYKEILMNFPNGFYATFVRNRIQELQNIQS